MDVQCVGESETGQPFFVFAVGLEFFHICCVARPQGDFVAVLGEMEGEGGAPRACAEDGDFHGFLPVKNWR